MDPLGKDPALDAERLEGGHPLPLGRQPWQVGTLEHVVEGEEASPQHLRGGDLAAAVVPGAERLVDRASVDPAHAADAVDAGRLPLDGHTLRDEGADGAAHLLVMVTLEARPLRPGEPAAVQARQGDPLGLAARQAEGTERPSRPRRWAMAPLARELNGCAGVSIPKTVRDGSLRGQLVGNVLQSDDVLRTFRKVCGLLDPAASGLSTKTRVSALATPPLAVNSWRDSLRSTKAGTYATRDARTTALNEGA